MNASDGMIVQVVGPSGAVLQVFTISDPKDIAVEDAHTMGERISESIMVGAKDLEAHHQKSMDLCTCFWKDKQDESRILNNSHSSECAVWDGDTRR